MPTRALGAIAVLAALSIHGCSDDDPAASPEPVQLSREYYGVAGHVLRLMSADGRAAEVDRHLAEIARLDLSFVRANLDWLLLEPHPPVNGRHRYDFESHDEWVAALAAHGLRWYALGVGTPRWASEPGALAAGCGIRSAPADPANFAALMGAIARRYGREGSFWKGRPGLPYRPVVDYEVWNEPNLGGFWCPAPEPARYADLYAAAEEAIHAVDPQARVVLGGLAPFAAGEAGTAPGTAKAGVGGFLAAVLAARPELAETIDVVGVHAYGEPSEVLAEVAWYRRTLAEVGLGDVPMSLNETGWTTRGQGGFVPATEAQRAAYLAEVTGATAKSDCGIISFSPHTWVTEEQDPADQEDWFGIADPATGAPYPSALSYERATKEVPAGSRIDAAEVMPLCGV